MMERKEYLIKVFEEAGDMSRALQRWDEENPGDPLIRKLMEILRLAEDKKLFADKLDAIKNFPYVQYSVEEQLLCLYNLSWAYIAAMKASAAYLLFSEIKRLLHPRLSAEWQIIPIELTALLQQSEGNLHGSVKLMELCLQKLGKKSKKYMQALWVYLNYLVLAFEREKWLAYRKEYTEIQGNASNLFWSLYIDAFAAIEYCHFDTVTQLKDQMIKLNKSMLQRNLSIIEKLSDMFVLHKFDRLDEQNYRDWDLLSTAGLLKKNSQEALKWARKYSEKITEYKIPSQFLAYYQVRADLANHNDQAAEYSLLSRQRVGNTTIMDNFFWFRIYHKRKKEKAAQEYVRKIQKDIENKGIEQRIKIEIKLSPELTEEIFKSYLPHKIDVQNIETEIAPVSESKPMLENWFIGKSKTVIALREQIDKFASLQSNILILGETGTGKDLTAKALHTRGSYCERPFIAINCGAVSDHLIQSELFGHVQGAFTGAHKEHHGFFETAQNGTVFLDEIGDISPAMQVNLLRVLESGEYKMIGSNTIHKIQCRIITATNRNLPEMVKNGKFRQDLYFRLERLTVVLPPLRERKEDVVLLCDYFLNQLNPTLHPLKLDQEVKQYLTSHPWPGNIRELRNEMEYLRMFHSDNKIVQIKDLSERLRKGH